MKGHFTAPNGIFRMYNGSWRGSQYIRKIYVPQSEMFKIGHPEGGLEQKRWDPSALKRLSVWTASPSDHFWLDSGSFVHRHFYFTLDISNYR